MLSLAGVQRAAGENCCFRAGILFLTPLSSKLRADTSHKCKPELLSAHLLRLRRHSGAILLRVVKFRVYSVHPHERDYDWKIFKEMIILHSLRVDLFIRMESLLQSILIMRCPILHLCCSRLLHRSLQN